MWIWLPEETEPVVAGLVTKDRGRLIFNYGRTYLERNNAIPIYEPELPLRPGHCPHLLRSPCQAASAMPLPMPGAEGSS